MFSKIDYLFSANEKRVTEYMQGHIFFRDQSLIIIYVLKLRNQTKSVVGDKTQEKKKELGGGEGVGREGS